jgi:hypothetical protein
MLEPMRDYENFTYEFLSSIVFTKDRLNYDNPNHRVSFRLMNILICLFSTFVMP